MSAEASIVAACGAAAGAAAADALQRAAGTATQARLAGDFGAGLTDASIDLCARRPFSAPGRFALGVHEPGSLWSKSETDAGPLSAVVVAGVIANERPLRRRLVAAGRCAASAGPAELMARLIGLYLQRGAGMHDALRQSLCVGRGVFALAALAGGDTAGPCVAAGARGARLLLGLGHGEAIIASSRAALARTPLQIAHLEEGDIVSLDGEFARIQDPSGLEMTRALNAAPTSAQAATFPLAAAAE